MNLSFEEPDMPIIELRSSRGGSNAQGLVRAHTGGGNENGEPVPPPQSPETPEEERNRPTQPELPDPAEVGEDG